MPQPLSRLIRPASIAVIGGGGWCSNVIRECQRIGYQGAIWPVHPVRAEVAGLRAYASVADLPGAPDASFVGVNRTATIEVIRALSAMGAGGAVCFASGFAEATAELSDGADLQAALLQAAGDMRLLGPNCYGFINALDGAALWPDQHGCLRVDSGVAILTQSSNIALNLTMQRRGLPIAAIGTLGNQAQTDLADLGQALLEDPRITALGLHIEGIRDIRALEALAARAKALGKGIVALKIGASDQARAATVSHTASLAGSDAGGRALLARLGIAQVGSLAALLEALKILHVVGPLRSDALASMSCSGGEASVMADSALGLGLRFPPLSAAQSTALRAALGPKVALANPLDYHTYIWGDEAALTACFTAMVQGAGLGMGCVVLDFPRSDRCDASDWDHVVRAVVATARATGTPMALLASLPENMPEDVAQACVAQGIVPLCGITESLQALAAAALLGLASAVPEPVALVVPVEEPQTLSEAKSKALLAQHGLRVPRAMQAATPALAASAARDLGGLLALKGEGVAHKTESGAVVLGLAPDQVEAEAVAMGTTGFLVEEMVSGGVAELLVGVVADPAHGFVLTLAAGGVLTELFQDSVSMLLPVGADEIEAGLAQLRLAPVLAGYRGAAAVDRLAIVSAVLAVQAFVLAHPGQVAEVEINPLICGSADAVAVDALIRGARFFAEKSGSLRADVAGDTM